MEVHPRKEACPSYVRKPLPFSYYYHHDHWHDVEQTLELFILFSNQDDPSHFVRYIGFDPLAR